jgi:hypothetical protein
MGIRRRSRAVHMARLRFRTRSTPPEKDASGRAQVRAAVVERPAPPEPARRTNLLGLVDHAIDDWARTLRLMVLVITTGGCVAAILFVLQLQPDRWASAIAVAASVVGVLRFRRRGGGDEPPEDGGGE